ncbi:epi-isozizaene 5-monooxygenase [Nonomuraea solani]|uniref:Epi-isozizaene 5-monooxygenase n=1 Tax=Nonomuraea solani TaxID=1144553 RepID=A0A1H6EQS2_9ACTN|nr:cytochrome P450 [Nonomuraea solani]SEG99763.1 epi-isozizaene 5-monooxygenase [Nonomuraea solani]
MNTETAPQAPPLAAGAKPFLGHGWEFLRAPLAFLTSLRDHGEIVRVRLGPRTVYAVCAPEPLGELLVKHARSAAVGGPMWDTLQPLLGQGLATINGPLHRRRRRMMQPWFQPDRVAGHTAAMAQEARALTRRWQAGQIIDVGEELSDCTVRMIARSLLGSESIATRAGEVSVLLHTVFACMYRRLILSAGPLAMLPTFTGRPLDRALTRLHQIIDEAIAEHRARGVDDDDLIGALLTAKDEESGQPLSDQEIHDHVASVLVAGTENVAYTLAWAFLLLSQHPREEARLREEADAIAGEHPPGAEDLRTLSHTRNIVMESMRLHPAIWLLTRHTTDPVEIGGHLIPADADIIYSPYAMQRDPRSFEHPLTFDPDRWSPERADGVPRFAMMPFGTGNRKCAGEHFSMIAITLLLTAVTSRWHLTPAPGTDLTTHVGITLQPKRSHMRVEAR